MNWVKYVIAFLVPVAAVMVFHNSLDNDSWYVLAEGREIVENGIYYEDQLSMHEDLEVTVQNYGFAAIFYLFYSAFGGVGIYIAMLVLNGVLCYLIYKVCMLLSNKNVNLSLILMMLTDLLLSYSFITTRAQVVSYVIMMLVIYILELYIKTDKSKYLWWIPVLSLVQINLHASLWPMILLIIGVCILDGIKQPKLHLEGYRKKPLIVVGMMAFLVGFLNPYGVRMMTFILTSYGVPEANDYVNELKSFDLGSNFHILLYTMIAVVMVLYIFAKNKNIRVRWLLMLFGFLALGINTIKGMSQLILVLFFPMAAVYRNVRIEKWGTRKIRWMLASWVGILALATVGTYVAVVLPGVNMDGPSEEMIAAIDILDREVGDVDKETLNIYVGYNEGGYLEYRGYKSYMDPRMEVFIRSNNGKADIFQEYYDFSKGKIEKDDFLERYDFDYIVVREDERLYDLSNDEFELIYEKDDEENNASDDEFGEVFGVRIYKKND
ncbi:hypothetical protein IJG27_01285 [Candidatus Saccharibacteria bacterium]|nr:hypothetical protein [Candidatus Saccharibacteria bacterium]